MVGGRVAAVTKRRFTFPIGNLSQEYVRLVHIVFKERRRGYGGGKEEKEGKGGGEEGAKVI